MIISDGYNGTPSGFENVCEDEEGITKPYVLHAEANAITKLARSGNNSEVQRSMLRLLLALSAQSSSFKQVFAELCMLRSIVLRMV